VGFPALHLTAFVIPDFSKTQINVRVSQSRQKRARYEAPLDSWHDQGFRAERLQLTVYRIALFDQRATDIDLLYI
jgi:hypothetical protein